jgi:hypothetical protein
LRAPGEGEGVEGGTRGGLRRGNRRRGRGVGRGRGFRRAAVAVAVAVVGGGGDENHGREIERARGGRGREGDRQRTVAKVFKKRKRISHSASAATGDSRDISSFRDSRVGVGVGPRASISFRAGLVQPHGDPSARSTDSLHIFVVGFSVQTYVDPRLSRTHGDGRN